ncbi:ATPase domain-containing protein [Halorubrum gandharaense]
MSSDERASTGIEGFDDVLRGGLVPERSYMLRGGPGTGKTIVGCHFLTAGVAAGESTLFVNFEEPTERVRENARSLGFDLSNVTFLDLTTNAETFTEDRGYGIFEADEVEAGDVSHRIVDAVDRVEPDRAFVDPMTQLRNVLRDDAQFRREAASFMRYLTDQGVTTLFTTQPSYEGVVDDLEFLCDGSFALNHEQKGRTLTVNKYRGSGFQSGSHTVRIDDGGLSVFPKLVPTSHQRTLSEETVSSGVPALDDLLHGGIERGSITVISGPSGVGKTTTGTHFVQETAERGERSVVYSFEEDLATFTHRSESIGLPVNEMRDRGTLSVAEVEPLDISADEFAAMVREEVEERDARTVMIDGISGYRMSIRGAEDDLLRELHALCRYLRNMGVTAILVDDVGTVTGDFEPTSDRISYLADNILFLRYLEMNGELREATGVLKKRASDFERMLREFSITEDGIVLGEPLRNLRGILTGTPELRDDTE